MKNRWVILASSVLIQSILGGIYAWSTFVPHLENQYHLTKSQLSLVFGLCITTFTVVMIFAGRWLSHKGPRPVAITGALLFLLGYMVASLSNGSFVVLLLGMSLLVGAGIGLGYVTSLSVSMRWFPQHKGIVTGVAVGGFGAGAIVLVNVVEYWFAHGLGVLQVFEYVGWGSGIPLAVAALLLQDPAGTNRQQNSSSGWLQHLKKPQFLLLFAGLYTGSFAGLMVVSNLQPMAQEAGLTAAMAPLAVSLFAVGNAAGRIAWGFGFEQLKYRSMPFSLLVNVLVLALALLPGASWLFLVAAALMGFGYGAAFVVYASATTRFFGLELFSTLYPIIFLAYGLAAFSGPWVGGVLRQQTGSYQVPLMFCAGIMLLGSALLWWGLRKFHKI